MEDIKINGKVVCTFDTENNTLNTQLMDLCNAFLNIKQNKFYHDFIDDGLIKGEKSDYPIDYKKLETVLESCLNDTVRVIIMPFSKEMEYESRVMDLIDKKIRTLQDNSRQCHESGSHEKGMEFTSQALLLERLKKELME